MQSLSCLVARARATSTSLFLGDYSCGNPDRSGVFRDVSQDYRICTYYCIVTDPYTSKDFCASSKEYVIPYYWNAWSASTSNCDMGTYCYVVPDFTPLMYYDTQSVVREKHIPTYFELRRNHSAETKPNYALH